jgi:SAM-dependent methyltransferase
MNESQYRSAGQSSIATEKPVRRLHWGCGKDAEPGWINSDAAHWPGVDLVVDILEGLPLETESIDYAVSVHALPEIPYKDLTTALGELRRVLRTGGALRLVLPDIDKGIAAYQRGDRDYFFVRDEAGRSVGAKFIIQTIWFGHTVTPFNHDFIEEQLLKAGFTGVHRCAYRQTASPFPEIVSLDNRERESLFVEAVK